MVAVNILRSEACAEVPLGTGFWFCNDCRDILNFSDEARALYEGLQLTWERGYSHVELESCNRVLIESISGGCAADSNLVELRLVS